MQKPGSIVHALIRTARPVPLAAAAAAYSLGGAIASYLAIPVDGLRFLWGLLFTGSLHLFICWVEPAFFPGSIRFHRSGAEQQQTTPPPRTFLHAALLALAGMGTSLSGLLLQGGLSSAAWLLLSLLLLTVILYTVPPHPIHSAGLSEVWRALLLGIVFPAFSYSLVAGDMHRLLPMSTTALAAFYFAAEIISLLKSYAADTTAGNKTFVTRIGWEKAMLLHDAALVAGFFSLGLAYLFGYPARIAWSMFIVLPLAAAQIVQIGRIRLGAPPKFRLMEITAYVIFFLTLYFQLVGFLR